MVTYINFPGILDTTAFEFGRNVHGGSHLAHLGIRGLRCTLDGVDVPTCSQAEITDLDMRHAVGATADEDVLGLEVSVNQVVQPMDVDQSFQDFAKQSPDLIRVLIKVLVDEAAKGLCRVSPLFLATPKEGWKPNDLPCSRSIPSKCIRCSCKTAGSFGSS